MINYCAFPAQLKSLPNWVVWRLEKRSNGSKSSKPTKVPYDAKTGKRAKSNDSSTWCNFDTAHAIANQEVIPGAEHIAYNGIGFMFPLDGRIFGIDLDDCYNPETGDVKPWAQEIVDLANSYTEISPSGSGLHIYLTQADTQLLNYLVY